MEDTANLTKRGRGVACPTRLQKHAPASLDIDKVLSDRPTNPFDETSKAIPLLSPLILSPQPLHAQTTIQAQAQARTSENDGNRSNINEGWSSFSTPRTGWQHPAMAPFPEPSSLCSLFQKQCVFVNQAQ